ncbi:MAG: hypothetical protein ABW328_03640 [Ilumatobacteraceae bacterium]
MLLNWAWLTDNDNTQTAVNLAARCDEMEPLWLEAQAVPTASSSRA